MQILAIYSNKGGVGKTATAVNLAYLSALSGKRTLICDLDFQGAATFYYRIKPKLKKKARNLLRFKSIQNSIKETDFKNLDLLPADISHRKLDTGLSILKSPKKRLAKVLKPLKKHYDIIILDCPPSFNFLAENVFHVSSKILVPLIPTTLSLRNHKQLISFFEKEKYDLKKIHAFFSLVDSRKNIHNATKENTRQEYKRVLKSEIPYLSTIEKMGVTREPVVAFAKGTSASKAYENLWKEVSEKVIKR